MARATLAVRSPTPPAAPPARRVPPFAGTLLGVVLLVGTIDLAKPVLVPLALAILFAFILNPLVGLVQRWRVPRVPAVLAVVLVTLVGAGGIGWGVFAQVNKLAADLPSYQPKIQKKIDGLRAHGTGSIGRLIQMAQDVTTSKAKDVDRSEWLTFHVTAAPAETSSTARMLEYAGTVLEPIADGFLVLILVIFMLIRREDLRNRMIGLLGHGRLTGTTRVTVEAGARVSKLLLAQASVNGAFGMVFGAGLMALGVEYAFLWGFVMALLRFIPYVGSWLGAAAPVLVSFATTDGWGHPLGVLGLFVGLDLVTANVIEPVLFGHSTGVSPVALLVAAAFWTWIWGPVGLVLSTPMTVCLAVLGQEVPRLKVLSLLLGDQPALDPHVSYYQRLLATDKAEAAEVVVRRSAAAADGDKVFDTVLLPALRLMRRDRTYNGLTPADEAFILDATQQVVAALPEPAADGELPLVLAVPAHHRAEELSLQMLAKLLAGRCRVEVVSTRVLPNEILNRVERDQPAAVFVAVMPPGGLVQARYLCRRIGKRFASVRIVVGYWARPRTSTDCSSASGRPAAAT